MVMCTHLGDRSVETVIISIRRAALAVRAKKFLLPERKRMRPYRIFSANLRAALAIRKEKFLIARAEIE